jgi:hypothetical protein
MSSSATGAEVRFFICPTCGGSLTVPSVAGRADCPYCAAVVVVGARRTDRLRFQIDDASTRIYDDRSPPQGFEFLSWFTVEDSLLAPMLLQAFLVGCRLRRESAEGATADADDDEWAVTWLALRLAETMTWNDNPYGARAGVETALELVARPDCQQLLLCAGANIARRMGDEAAAAAWIALCEPAPGARFLDSEYRVTAAAVAIAAGDATRAVQLAEGMQLGARPGRNKEAFELGVLAAAHLAAGQREAAESCIDRELEITDSSEQNHMVFAMRHDPLLAEAAALFDELRSRDRSIKREAESRETARTSYRGHAGVVAVGSAIAAVGVAVSSGPIAVTVGLGVLAALGGIGFLVLSAIS